MNQNAKTAQLNSFLDPFPATKEIAGAVLRAWPEHNDFILKSMSERSPELMQTTETLASAALLLAGSKIDRIATHYRWTCDRLRDEELFFHREGRYRLSTFAEANEEVYSNAAYMEKYMDGLLFSQVLWFNHAASCHFFLTTTPKILPAKSRYLEIGPGHGLMMYLALREFDLDFATAWDLSAVSIEQTKHALSLLGFDNINFGVRDIMELSPGEAEFDLIVLSEILEHLEDPMIAMRHIRSLTTEGAYVFVNVPINSPSPDHLYLMQTLDDARALLTETGFKIVAEDFYATKGTPIDKALRRKVSISACMLATPAV
ncbi:class I SAM-dependent methyltransferase [Roseibium aggregatum]|uniref:Class I SAM-dependent methyltransferase n=1 Tax=Roseibium aggregatum TaxID=187304 RepID=A0A939ED31_9HYPH|nr:class I SAM-dependent methyltransferase [Roseibium aggregatum]MBN9669878.1 class I SAM-dependent methyltransferase [Roseibium aggregatum]